MSLIKNHPAASNWRTVRLARLSIGIQDGTHGTHERVESGVPLLSAKNVTTNGLEIGEAESQIAEAEAASIVADGFPRQNDVLLTIVGSIGRSAVYELPYPLPFQRSVCFIRPATNVDARYLSFALQSVEVQDQIKLRSKSSAQAGLYLGDVASLPIPRPPVEQQRRIAEFLDRETAQIEELIAKQKQLISTFAERRQSAVVQAVTTGLDSTRELRPTALPWAPAIPEDWSVEPVRNFTSFSTGWTPPSGEDRFYGGPHAWANISDLGGRVVFQTAKTITNEGVSIGRMVPAEEGDLLFSFKLSVGRVSRAGTRMFTNEAIAAFRPGPRIDLRFAFFALPLALLENASRNIYGAPLLNAQLIRSARVPLPPRPEQERIAAYLEQLDDRIQAATATAEKLVVVLRERRQALISAAVTGQIDVGGAS